MDNVTHTLAGLLLADVALELGRRRGRRVDATEHDAVILVSILANNAPDLDVTYQSITEGKLGYLLHHRGHSHTLLAALLLAPLSVALALGLLRLARKRLDALAARRLLGFAGMGVLLHLAMDACNNYGVHPFWPLDSRWIYGDVLFIVEPWLLLILSGAAFGATRSPIQSIVFSLLSLLLLLVAAYSGRAGWPLLIALSGFAVIWSITARRLSPARRVAASLTLVATLLAVQWLGRAGARVPLSDALARDAGTATLARVETPAPGNPLCWSTLVVQRSGAQHVVRRAVSSAWPALIDARSCFGWDDETTAPLEPVASELAELTGPALSFQGEFRAPIDELEQTLEGCHAAAAARFLRVPFWIRHAGRTTVIGDLRYDRSPGLGFAELALPVEREPAACPRYVPGWQPPFSASR